MVVGLAVVGWFLARPHAEAIVDDAALRRSGEVKLSAAPGLGYTYRWEAPGLPSGDFSDTSSVTVKLEPGETKNVVLRVRNAFNAEAEETFSFTRPPARRSPTGPSTMLTPTGAALPAEQIPALIQPKGLQ
jgi:NADH-quinone oxidoreductase subunit L